MMESITSMSLSFCDAGVSLSSVWIFDKMFMSRFVASVRSIFALNRQQQKCKQRRLDKLAIKTYDIGAVLQKFRPDFEEQVIEMFPVPF